MRGRDALGIGLLFLALAGLLVARSPRDAGAGGTAVPARVQESTRVMRAVRADSLTDPEAALPGGVRFLEPPSEPAPSAEPPRAPASEAPRAAHEGAEDDLPPAPGPLPADPSGPYGTKYAGLYPNQLEAAQKELRRRQALLANPLFEQRFQQGQYRVVGPLARGLRSELITGGEYAPAERPLIQYRGVPLDEGFEQLLVVEIHPYELPEGQALRDEELWLQDRIDELEKDW